jgi:hypothetical protein
VTFDTVEADRLIRRRPMDGIRILFASFFDTRNGQPVPARKWRTARRRSRIPIGAMSAQSSVGRSIASMTSISTGPLAGSSFSPSCS